MKYRNLEKCRDYGYLKENLSTREMEIVENILDAYLKGRIDLIIPRDENEEILFDGEFELISDKLYKKTGFELLVMKWIEDIEDTGYLVDCLKEDVIND